MILPFCTYGSQWNSAPLKVSTGNLSRLTWWYLTGLRFLESGIALTETIFLTFVVYNFLIRLVVIKDTTTVL